MRFLRNGALRAALLSGGARAPRIVLSGSRSQAEGTAINTTIGALSVVGHVLGTYSFSETADPDNVFSLSGSNLRNSAEFDYEVATSHSVTIEGTSNNGADPVLTKTFVIAVADVDEVAPTITSANSGNNPENTVLAHALTANESVTWSIVGGADQARFEISGSTLRWAANGTKDFENPNDSNTNNTYVVDVRATDAASNTTDQTITITVTDVDDVAPTITSTDTASVAENATLSKALTANETVTWSIVGGADQGRFELSGSTLRWLSNGTKDYETPNDADTNNTYVVTVRATDMALNTTDQTITVTVTDVDEVAPVLSLPADTKTGSTTADIGATTDEGNGTLFVAVTTTATPPSSAQIIAGSGGGIVVANSAAVGSTGAKTVGVTGLTASTSYFGHAVHRDAANNISNVVTGNGFTTDASGEAWDSGKKHADITLSNGNKTATRGTSGGQANVKSVNGHSTGKYHVKFTVTTKGSFCQLGFASASRATNAYLGISNTDSAAIGSGHFQYFNDTGINIGSVNFDISDGNQLAGELDLDSSPKVVRYKNITKASGWSTDRDLTGLTNLPWFIAMESDGSSVVILDTSDLTGATSGFGAW